MKRVYVPLPDKEVFTHNYWYCFHIVKLFHCCNPQLLSFNRLLPFQFNITVVRCFQLKTGYVFLALAIPGRVRFTTSGIAVLRQFSKLCLKTLHKALSGGGGTPLYKLFRYVPPQRVWFLSRFGLKTGIDFDHFGLKSGIVFKGTTRA